jgi:2-polyprenyl-3-methyl-5-hydroxy-6-metoxy-1,4-benzoquinol methylase
MGVPGFDPERQSTPALREPVPCGEKTNLVAGREPTQMGWYQYVAKQTKADELVLDVGAGTCAGLNAFAAQGIFAMGLERDERMRGWHNRLIIADIADLPPRSIDVVTCFDVIEHVVDDTDFLRHLLRITRRRLYVTTPNFTRSGALNGHHAREVTIPQFLRHYRPDELHGASPDGWHNRTLLAHSIDGYAREPATAFRIARGKLVDRVFAYANVPDDLSFTDTTIDGLEWPHMLGVWNLG